MKLVLSCRTFTTAKLRKKDGERAQHSNFFRLMRSLASSKVGNSASSSRDKCRLGCLSFSDIPFDFCSIGVKHAVDLCAAPGSWSQVLSKRLWEPAAKCVCFDALWRRSGWKF